MKTDITGDRTPPARVLDLKVKDKLKENYQRDGAPIRIKFVSKTGFNESLHSFKYCRVPAPDLILSSLLLEITWTLMNLPRSTSSSLLSLLGI